MFSMISASSPDSSREKSEMFPSSSKSNSFSASGSMDIPGPTPA